MNTHSVLHLHKSPQPLPRRNWHSNKSDSSSLIPVGDAGGGKKMPGTADAHGTVQERRFKQSHIA